GSPKYSIGNTDAAARFSASRSPRQVVNAIAPSATNPAITTTSTGPIEAITVATPAGTTGIATPPARASTAYSMNASATSSSTTAKNRSGGANHTTATAIAMSAAPLTTRVIERPAWCRLSTVDSRPSTAASLR